ncbi:hypothetical protein IWX76_002241 [Pedobacter sp. CAN_A7]|uniref:DUF4932 domain-containing protein n=1 Tax=Pedobacter sp. CAN_A7 TaxID=2787722 RepID=UPI0018CAC36E
MRFLYPLAFFLALTSAVSAQYKTKLAAHAFVGIHPNLETYFFVEKLAVEHINNYVFNIKGTDYSHQPIVHFAFQHFQPYQNDPIVIRVAEILRQLRDTYHDNGPIMDYLINQQEFPAKGPRFSAANKELEKDSAKRRMTALMPELRDSLRSFYRKADVGGFLQKNHHFYQGAIREVAKNIHPSAFPAIEKWYGKTFPQYELYISPAMPITPGDDSYRGYGAQISFPGGKIPSMVVSSSKMLTPLANLNQYQEYGFDNRDVTQFVAYHEIIHSFVNPVLEKYADELKADSDLYIQEWKEKMAPYGISDWYICVTEHLVRLGEIRIALAMGNAQEADRLRKLHVEEQYFVLLPLLEKEIVVYEADRVKYLSFENYLPRLVSYFRSLTPEQVSAQFLKYNTP